MEIIASTCYVDRVVCSSMFTEPMVLGDTGLYVSYAIPFVRHHAKTVVSQYTVTGEEGVVTYLKRTRLVGWVGELLSICYYVCVNSPAYYSVIQTLSNTRSGCELDVKLDKSVVLTPYAIAAGDIDSSQFVYYTKQRNAEHFLLQWDGEKLRLWNSVGEVLACIKAWGNVQVKPMVLDAYVSNTNIDVLDCLSHESCNIFERISYIRSKVHHISKICSLINTANPRDVRIRSPSGLIVPNKEKLVQAIEDCNSHVIIKPRYCPAELSLINSYVGCKNKSVSINLLLMSQPPMIDGYHIAINLLRDGAYIMYTNPIVSDAMFNTVYECVIDRVSEDIVYVTPRSVCLCSEGHDDPDYILYLIQLFIDST